MQLEKVCTKCGTPKPLDEFGTVAKGSLSRRAACKLCLREGARARSKKYYQTHRDQAVAKSQTYRDQHPEKAPAHHRRWYAANRDRKRAAHAAWCKANAQTCVAYVQRRRVRLSTVENTLKQHDVEVAIEMSGGLCAYCLKPYNKPTVDHVIPLSKSGPNTADNIVIACKPCNSAKKNRGVLCMVNKAA